MIQLPDNRDALETLIEAAIARLDAMDGDPDLEDAGDAKPGLGSRELWTGNESAWAHGEHDERELDTADLEPSLGSLERGPEQSQIGWAFSGDDDRELEPSRFRRSLRRYRRAELPTISAADCMVFAVVR